VSLASSEPRCGADSFRSTSSVRCVRVVSAPNWLRPRARRRIRAAHDLYICSARTQVSSSNDSASSKCRSRQLVAALGATPQVKYYQARPDELAREVAWYVDISQDGVIIR